MIDAAYIDTVLGEVAGAIGLSTLKLDDSGACAFAVDDGAIRVDLQFQPRFGAIDIVVWPGRIELSETRLDAMLAANFCWRATEGATFGLEPLSGTPVLQRRCFEHELATGRLPAAIERLVRHARTWPKHLASIETRAADEQRVAPRPSGGLRA